MFQVGTAGTGIDINIAANDYPVLQLTNTEMSLADDAVVGRINFHSSDASAAGIGAYIEARSHATDERYTELIIGTGFNATPAAETFRVGRFGDLSASGNVFCDNSGNLTSANGASFGPGAVTSITVVNGIVTAIS